MKLFNALEEISPEVLHDSEISSELAEVREANSSVEEQESVIEEAEAINETVNNVRNHLESSGELGPSEETVELARIAVEHFCKRLGYTTNKVMPSLESYSKNESNAKHLVNNLKDMHNTVNKQLSIAKEGLLDTVKNKYSVMVTGRTKLVNRLKEVNDKYTTNGNNQENITGRAFTTILNSSNKKQISGTDVNNTLNLHIGVITSLIKNIEQTISYSAEINSALFKNSVEFNEKYLLKIEATYTSITGLTDQVSKLTSNNSKCDAEPVNSSDYKKLNNLIISIIDNKRNDSAIYKFINAMYILRKKIQENIINKKSTDVNITKAVDLLNKIYREFIKIDQVNFEVAHAAVEYIKFSTKK